jgi:hypothetical protein
MSELTTANAKNGSKRTYRRRTDEERIADLKRQIELEKERMERKREDQRKKREVNPAVKKIPQLAKHLQKFSQLAVDNNRLDLSNMVTMFLVGLHRIHEEETASARSHDEVEFEAEEQTEPDYGGS